MLFALDIGNSRLKWSLYERPHSSSPVVAQGVCFLENIDQLAENDWASLPVPKYILGCIVAGDAIKGRVKEQLDIWQATPQWVVASDAEGGITNGYDYPTRLGADRWIAMIGARQRAIQQGFANKPLVVVMVGTAVTVEAIDPSGKFLGGFIIPGHGIMLKALESGTAGLHVPTGDVVPFPTNTSDALTSGGTYAIAGAVERMMNHVRELCKQEPHCIMTGGAGWKMAPSMSTPFELVDNLIFDGLLAIAEQRFHQN
jgi:type III pantothenate kinase